jgi:hypothetical protein
LFRGLCFVVCALTEITSIEFVPINLTTISDLQISAFPKGEEFLADHARVAQKLFSSHIGNHKRQRVFWSERGTFRETNNILQQTKQRMQS